MSHFRPQNEKEHHAGQRGEDVSDWCANCGAPFLEHENSKCPKDEDQA